MSGVSRYRAPLIGRAHLDADGDFVRHSDHVGALAALRVDIDELREFVRGNGQAVEKLARELAAIQSHAAKPKPRKRKRTPQQLRRKAAGAGAIWINGG